MVELKDPVDDVYYFGPLMDGRPGDEGLHPCSGSSFGTWWSGYMYGAFGAGEGAYPDPGLLETEFGSDAHLQYLLRGRPQLSLDLWGHGYIKLLDLLGDLRDHLSDLCERFPFEPAVPPRFLVDFMSTYDEADTFFAAHPQHDPETYFQDTDEEGDEELDEGEEESDDA